MDTAAKMAKRSRAGVARKVIDGGTRKRLASGRGARPVAPALGLSVEGVDGSFLATGKN